MCFNEIGSRNNPAKVILSAPTCIGVKYSNPRLIRIKEDPQIKERTISVIQCFGLSFNVVVIMLF